MVVLALGVMRLATVATTARLSLGLLGGTKIRDRIGNAVGLGARTLVTVWREIGLLLGHFAHILSEGNTSSCVDLSANASISYCYII